MMIARDRFIIIQKLDCLRHVLASLVALKPAVRRVTFARL